MEPMLPPIKASTKSVDSGIRQARFLALYLSTPITMKLIKLMAARYIIISVIAFIRIRMSLLCDSVTVKPEAEMLRDNMQFQSSTTD